jgi:uncharacterized alpha/beta hydrolase family protein
LFEIRRRVVEEDQNNNGGVEERNNKDKNKQDELWKDEDEFEFGVGTVTVRGDLHYNQNYDGSVSYYLSGSGFFDLNGNGSFDDGDVFQNAGYSHTSPPGIGPDFAIDVLETFIPYVPGWY